MMHVGRFVLFSFLLNAVLGVKGGEVFINEIHYENQGTDVGEFVEVAFPTGTTDISSYKIVLYKGKNGKQYKTISLSRATFGSDSKGLSFCYVETPDIRNGNKNGDGIALVDPSGSVVEFLSYETDEITAINGPAKDMTSTDIRVKQKWDAPVGTSLRLGGTGCSSSDFVWQSDDTLADTRGDINVGQTISCSGDSGVLEFVGWAHQDSSIVPLGLCQGDCNKDQHCDLGLSCLERTNGDDGPEGCNGAPIGGRDYCYVPGDGILVRVANNGVAANVAKLERCQGHCNSDSDCALGLSCFERTGVETVPGCIAAGNVEGIWKTNYCYADSSDTTAPPSWPPTSSPTESPTTVAPTPVPTNTQTTVAPTPAPTASTSLPQSASPTTATPTVAPTASTPSPTLPTDPPTLQTTTFDPTPVPSVSPTPSPALPTDSPTRLPLPPPSETLPPTLQTTTYDPTPIPTVSPTTQTPTSQATTSYPTPVPTTAIPTMSPTTSQPTPATTAPPTQTPTMMTTTSDPTPEPTTQPSSKPTVSAGTAELPTLGHPKPLIHTGACTASSPCGRCEGDCASDDSKCRTDLGLVCYSRTGDEPVVGCVTGGPGDVSGADYCYEAPGDGPVTYIPGDLTVVQNGLYLSTGLSSKIIAAQYQYVDYDTPIGAKSTDRFHEDPDGAAVFADPSTGGWIYVSNAESTRKGGVGAITFNSNGEVVDYKVLANSTLTKSNCGGGKTFWNTWLSCEEDDGGQVWEIDPWGINPPRKTIIGGVVGDWFESAAYDNRIPNSVKFYITVDRPGGPVYKFTPDAQAIATALSTNPPDYTDLLHTNTSGTAKVEYLLLSPSASNPDDGTFSWTDNLTEAEINAANEYKRPEGIDIRDGMVYFTTKQQKKLFILDLDGGQYESSSTESGAFDKKPDQVARLLNGDRSILYFCEDTGDTDLAGVHGRDSLGNYYTILESTGLNFTDETTGLAFSPDNKHLYVSYQDPGYIFDITRDDGYPFDGQRLDIKYHSPENVFGLGL